jgi:hypothetical protein
VYVQQTALPVRWTLRPGCTRLRERPDMQRRFKQHAVRHPDRAAAVRHCNLPWPHHDMCCRHLQRGLCGASRWQLHCLCSWCACVQAEAGPKPFKLCFIITVICLCLVVWERVGKGSYLICTRRPARSKEIRIWQVGYLSLFPRIDVKSWW